MLRHFARRWGLALVCLLIGLALAFASYHRARKSGLVVSPGRDVLPANGYAETKLNVSAEKYSPNAVVWTFTSGRELADIEMKGPDVYLRAGVNPGLVTLIARAPGFPPAQTKIQLNLDPTDQFGDGTPDFLRLDSQEDRSAFRHWFAFLAESTLFQPEKDRPIEINDCAALIRFAYRETLRRHDASWAIQWHLNQLPGSQSVKKYTYPHTALFLK
ncbi:MAG TPA: DUF1175 family protein [Terriglobales bacterium]|nr:DUF1175 family protein [Terriglobales bacterium]